MGAFYDSTLLPCLDAVGLHHAVVDFGLVPPPDTAADAGDVGALHQYAVCVLELNSFGLRSGAAMYNWDDEADCLQLFQGPFSFRIRLE
eukprot:NODE_4170_length_358_cov_321.857605_g3584_i0.p1 GENE.NODE_4170_length_358_cov_321.857605_g3584_i0~~NODE_4170_length_358_cov_321.857605_g3584_i0.p1  ORF type:complete len:98 (-),score=32.03 NODE_4170_length_358_cov_321.857605_g3584_i0:65-331(-)